MTNKIIKNKQESEIWIKNTFEPRHDNAVKTKAEEELILVDHVTNHCFAIYQAMIVGTHVEELIEPLNKEIKTTERV